MCILMASRPDTIIIISRIIAAFLFISKKIYICERNWIYFMLCRFLFSLTNSEIDWKAENVDFDWWAERARAVFEVNRHKRWKRHNLLQFSEKIGSE